MLRRRRMSRLLRFRSVLVRRAFWVSVSPFYLTRPRMILRVPFMEIRHLLIVFPLRVVLTLMRVRPLVSLRLLLRVLVMSPRVVVLLRWEVLLCGLLVLGVRVTW